MDNNPVVEIKNIKKYFPLRSFGKKNVKYVKAVDGVTLDVYEGETLSLIHISEPTRQAEISYAVFCLKKKKKNMCHTTSFFNTTGSVRDQMH